MDDPADLSRLADIVLPPPVAWWPPAPGWWIVAAALIAAGAILFAAALRRYRRDAYRRAALAELAAVGAVADAAGAVSVSAILKRTALAAFPRADVAALTGTGWASFLDRTGATTEFTQGPAASLATAAFGAPIGDGAAIAAAARRWIRSHRAKVG